MNKIICSGMYLLLLCSKIGFPLQIEKQNQKDDATFHALDKKWQPLFNGQNLDNWEKFLGPPFPGLEHFAKTATSDNVFSVVERNGEKLIRISGEVHGALATKDSFENYHLRLVFKWGEHVTQGRNSGLLYHSYGPFGTAYGTWMASMECQLMHGSLGDSYLMVDEVVCESSARASADGKAYLYKPGAAKVQFGEWVKRRMIKTDTDPEKPLGEWNTVDLYCLGNRAVQVVNGKTVMVVENIGRFKEGKVESLTRGLLQLQSEGAELFVKSMAIQPISKIPAGVF